MVEIGFDFEFQEAIWAAMGRQVVLPDEYYGQKQGIARALAFSVANMAQLDQIQQVLDGLNQALKNGSNFEEWRKNILTAPEALALPLHRLDNIFRTNLQSAYSRGQWAQQEQDAKLRPYLLYSAINDSRVRPNHLAMDGMVAKYDDPVWLIHYPPNGYRCRCSTISLSEKKAKLYQERDAKKIQRNPQIAKDRLLAQPDKGWDYHGGAFDPIKKAEAIEAEKLRAAEKKLAEQMAAKQAAIEAIKAVAKERGELALQQAMDRIAAETAKWKLAEALAGNLGKWYNIAAKKGVTTTAELDALALALENSFKQKKNITAYKKSAIAGKKPTKAQQDAFDALPMAEQMAITNEIMAAMVQAMQAKQAAPPPVSPPPLPAPPAHQPAPAPPPAPPAHQAPAPAPTPAPAPNHGQTPAAAASAQAAAAIKVLDHLGTLDGTGWNQIGQQKGSNQGGTFEAPDGTLFYVKFPASDHHAHNEVLAAKLYEQLGIYSPEVSLIRMNGKLGVASKIIDGTAIDAGALKAGTVDGIWDGFGADAWLANWDVIGLGYDNMKVVNGKALRLDTGGALEFRAQGSPKGAAFGENVTELQTLKSHGLNPQAASVFGNMTDDQLYSSVSKVIGLSDQLIMETVLAYGYGDQGQRLALAKKLLARKQSMIKTFPEVAAEIASKKTNDADAANFAAGQGLGWIVKQLSTLSKDIDQSHSAGWKVSAGQMSDLADILSDIAEYKKIHFSKLTANSQTDIAFYLDEQVKKINDALANGLGGAALKPAAMSFNAALVDVALKNIKASLTLKEAQNLLAGVGLSSKLAPAPPPLQPNLKPVPPAAPPLPPTTAKKGATTVGKKKTGTYTEQDIFDIFDQITKASGRGYYMKSGSIPNWNAKKVAIFDKLPAGWKRLLWSWTPSEIYSWINKNLFDRAEGKYCDPAAEAYEAAINHVLANVPATLKHKGDSARGAFPSQVDADKYATKLKGLMNSGQPYNFEGISSSTAGKVPDFKSRQVWIYITGKSGVHIQPISEFGKNQENEVLWGTETQFRVDSVDKDSATGRWHIKLTEL